MGWSGSSLTTALPWTTRRPSVIQASPLPTGHGGEQEKDPLGQVIQRFNERWFQGWGVTTEEKRVKFLSILQGI